MDPNNYWDTIIIIINNALLIMLNKLIKTILWVYKVYTFNLLSILINIICIYDVIHNFFNTFS